VVPVRFEQSHLNLLDAWFVDDSDFVLFVGAYNALICG